MQFPLHRDNGVVVIAAVGDQADVQLFKAVWQAHREFFRRRSELKVVRGKIQAAKKASPRYIYRRSIILRYICGNKTFGKLL